jgi:hypothetical protein
MDPAAVLALCHEHAGAEAEFDVDRIMATFVPEPRYDFFPLARSVTGWANAERFYRDQYPRFVDQVVGYQLLGEWANEQAAIQEYVIDMRANDGTTAYHVVSMMPVDDRAKLLTGERIYCDAGFVRALLGPLVDLLEPVAGS